MQSAAFIIKSLFKTLCKNGLRCSDCVSKLYNLLLETDIFVLLMTDFTFIF